MAAVKFIDPMKFAKRFWPHFEFYDKQVEIVYSVVDNYQTFVTAGNMLGKDFISAFIVLWFFMSRSPCRVVTTSADHEQLKSVLWGEIDRFIDEAAVPLRSEQGGPLIVNEMHLRRNGDDGKRVPLTSVVGRVAKKGEGFLGRHLERRGLPRSLLVIDEASGIDDEVLTKCETWAHRILVIGNPYPTTNFFYRGVKSGDQAANRRV